MLGEKAVISDLHEIKSLHFGQQKSIVAISPSPAQTSEAGSLFNLRRGAPGQTLAAV